MASDMLHDFGVNKVEKLKRSTWTVPLKHKTAFPQGVLIPLSFYDVIPGSTISDDVSALTRLALTPYKPFMSDVYLTYGVYFVPYRVLYKNYQNMFGNGKPSEWSNPQEYIMPTGKFSYEYNGTTSAVGAGYDAVYNSCVGAGSGIGNIISKPGNLANYLGLPTTKAGNANGELFNIAPFLAYERIWTDYWRDENYQNPDPDLEKAYEFASGNTDITNLRFCLHYANRFHDYLSSLLPNTQKGAAVQTVMPLHAYMDGNNPVFTALGGSARFSSDGTTSLVNGYLGISSVGNLSKAGSVTSGFTNINSTNLGTELSITELRNSFALQRIAERNGRCGSRYPEAMRGIFEANVPAVLDRAEFLGGNTIKLNLTSVPSTSSENTGKLGAFSATGSNTSSFVKTIDEPGIVMYVGTVRIKHVYQKSVEPYWLKSRRYHFYDPGLAHISEVPAYEREYCGAYNDDSPGTVIGFRPAWIEYEKPIDRVSGYLALGDTSVDLAKWVLQEELNSSSSYTPEKYLPENGDEIAKACIDFNSEYHSFQFIIDFQAKLKVTACKPLYAIPGFIDHIIA